MKREHRFRLIVSIIVLLAIAAIVFFFGSTASQDIKCKGKILIGAGGLDNATCMVDSGLIQTGSK